MAANATRAQLVLLALAALAVIAMKLLFSLVDVTTNEQQMEEIGRTLSPFHWEPVVLQPLEANYTSRLFNITKFRYVINPGPCKTPMLAVIIVTSYFGNVETRSSMRRAFSNDELAKLGLKRVFLLGEAPHDKYTGQNAIANEAKRFGDIVQGNFREAYKNLTYKHIMGLKWASEHCHDKAKYIIKMDDDIVVDVKKLVGLLSLAFPPNLLAGYIMRNMVPIREPANKWYVSEDEYKYSTYPAFVSGWFYVTTPKMAGKFVLLSNYVEYFWIDDLYVTGILARNLKIRHYDLGSHFAVHAELMQCCISDVIKNGVDCDFVIGPNGGENDLFFRFNDVMRRCHTFGCKKRSKPMNETCVAEKKISIGRGDGIIETYKLHR